MSDFFSVLQQVNNTAYQVAGVLQGVSSAFRGPGAPGTPGVPGIPGAPGMPAQYPTAYPTMTPDQLRLAMPAATPVPVAAQPVVTQPAQGGVMGVLSTLFSAIANFFKRIFGGNTTPAPMAGTMPVAMPTAVATAWPTSNPNAGDQLFAMLPQGRGTVLGFVQVQAVRQGDAFFVTAPGFGQACVFKQNGQYFYSENQGQPTAVSNVTSTRDAAGNTSFNITLASGKSVSAAIMADGRTLQYKGYTVTLS